DSSCKNPKIDRYLNQILSTELLLSSRFLHFSTVDGCNATLNSHLAASRSLEYVIVHAAIVICCCIFNASLTNDKFCWNLFVNVLLGHDFFHKN
ncbi:hypothetical protein L9F63_007433, partial [Diploptera punctata]